MPRILALDTATDACSVALQDGERTLHRFELAAQSHTRRLLPLVDELLAEAGWTLSTLDALAYGRGPGSFTGLRIGLGTVQGLAFAQDIPVIGVSTLEAMAVGYWAQCPEHSSYPVLTALDARMQEVYWCLFSPSEGRPVPCVEERVAAPAQVAEWPEVCRLESPWAGVGAGWHYPELRALSPTWQRDDVYPEARWMLPSAVAAWERGEAVAAEQAQPVYLRDTISWKKRERIRRR